MNIKCQCPVYSATRRQLLLSASRRSPRLHCTQLLQRTLLSSPVSYTPLTVNRYVFMDCLPSTDWLFKYHPVKHWTWKWPFAFPGSARVAELFAEMPMRCPLSQEGEDHSIHPGPLTSPGHAAVELVPILTCRVQSPGIWTLRKPSASLLWHSVFSSIKWGQHSLHSITRNVR